MPGTLLATPNETELLARTGSSAGGLSGLSAAARELLAGWQLPWLAVTLGSRGAMLHDGDGPLLVDAIPVTGQDTCGAGDCFAVALLTALVEGALPSEAVEAAVREAAEFVRTGAAAGLATGTNEPAGTNKPGDEQAAGTNKLGRDEQAAGTNKLAGTSEPALAAGSEVGAGPAPVARIRARGGTVVATGGCFDLLHPGHVSVLEAARRLGDCLIVCLNSDRSVHRLKGPGRPLQSEQDRATVLRALRCVDEVVVFEEDTPIETLRALRPDVWVKGGDYAGIELPEAAVLAEWGGVAVTVPYQAGRSTTSLVELAVSRHGTRRLRAVSSDHRTCPLPWYCARSASGTSSPGSRRCDCSGRRCPSTGWCWPRRRSSGRCWTSAFRSTSCCRPGSCNRCGSGSRSTWPSTCTATGRPAGGCCMPWHRLGWLASVSRRVGCPVRRGWPRSTK